MQESEFTENQEEFTRVIESILAALVPALTDAVVDIQKPVLETDKDKLKQVVGLDFIAFTKRLASGSKHICDALFELSKTQSDLHISIEGAVKDFLKMTTFFGNIHLNSKPYVNGIIQNKTIQEICGISPATIEALYQAAKYLYEQQDYQEASDAFGILVFLNSQTHLFWLGLGNSEFFCNHYQAALTAYAFAMRADPFDPHCHIYSCKCYEALGQIDQAINALDLALIAISDNKKYEALKPPLAAEKMRLQNKKTK